MCFGQKSGTIFTQVIGKCLCAQLFVAVHACILCVCVCVCVCTCACVCVHTCVSVCVCE